VRIITTHRFLHSRGICARTDRDRTSTLWIGSLAEALVGHPLMTDGAEVGKTISAPA
jgi:hypothetical protein